MFIFSFDHRNQASCTQLKTYTKIPWLTTEIQPFQNTPKKGEFSCSFVKLLHKEQEVDSLCNDILFFNSIQNTESK